MNPGEDDKRIFKARICARGCELNNAYASVVKMTTLHTLICIANQFKMNIATVDVSNALLNAPLKGHKIFMYLPEGYRKDNKICCLEKAIYGLLGYQQILY